MPESLKLQEFGQLVYDAFGEIPYHVGSSMGEKKTGWRDVDVRVMLSDKDYEKQGYGNPQYRSALFSLKQNHKKII